MSKFQQAKIYSIRSHKTDDIYIGSTTQALSKRMTNHRARYSAWLRDPTRNKATSVQILQHGDAYIELLEAYPCSNKDELHKREGHHIRANDCVNKMIPGRTKQEYYQDNIDRIRVQKKQYRQENAENLKQYRKKYYQDNAEKVNTQKKKHYQDNAEQIKLESKQYYQKNAEKIKARKNQRINCDYCNCTFARGEKASHIRTKKHINNYKQAYLECFGEEFTGTISLHDY